MPLFYASYWLTILWLLTGCVSLPNGPSVMVLPGSGIAFDQFRSDDILCRQFAFSMIGATTPSQAAVASGISSAAVGTALGAAAGGGAIAGGRGAAAGAGSGLVVGSVAGSGAASNSLYENQRRFDMAYIQCMYAKGHRVPVSGDFSDLTSHPVAQKAPVPPPPARFPYHSRSKKH